jgi:hypothetical protein
MICIPPSLRLTLQRVISHSWLTPDTSNGRQHIFSGYSAIFFAELNRSRLNFREIQKIIDRANRAARVGELARRFSASVATATSVENLTKRRCRDHWRAEFPNISGEYFSGESAALFMVARRPVGTPF